MTGGGEREDCAGEDADGDEADAFADDHELDVCVGGAEGDADADFASALAHAIGDHAVDTDGRQEEGERTEDGEEAGGEALRPEEVAGGGFEGLGLQEEVAVERLEGIAHGGDDGRGIAGSADVEDGGGEVILDEREVDEGLRVFADGLVVGGAGDADDLDGQAFSGEGDALADGVLAGPIGVGGGLIDDDNAGAGFGIERAEIAAAEEGDAHGLEVTGPDDAGEGGAALRFLAIEQDGA